MSFPKLPHRSDRRHVRQRPASLDTLWTQATSKPTAPPLPLSGSPHRPHQDAVRWVETSHL